MKVNEICAFNNGDFRFYPYYHAKINDKNVILERNLRYNIKVKKRNEFIGKLTDIITDVIYVDEKNIEEYIQYLVEQSRNIDIENSKLYSCIEPFQMQKGREIDLNLANIEICKPKELSDEDVPYYEYILNKKLEELKLDRSEQFKKEIQNNLDFYCLENYLERYEKQSGKKLNKLQIDDIKNFNNIIQDGVILGKYNLEDYRSFLQLIPDLLSQKKALAIGHYDSEGHFFTHGEIYEKQIEAENVAEYTTYNYHKLNKGKDRFSKENFKIISSPSIKKRMDPYSDNLCGIDLNNELNHYKKCKEEELVKLKGMEKNSDIKLVGYSKAGGVYSYNNSGILFSQIGRDLIKVKLQAKLSARDISTDLEEISREGLAINAQEHIIELTKNKSRGEEKSKEEI